MVAKYKIQSDWAAVDWPLGGDLPWEVIRSRCQFQNTTTRRTGRKPEATTLQGPLAQEVALEEPSDKKRPLTFSRLCHPRLFRMSSWTLSVILNTALR